MNLIDLNFLQCPKGGSGAFCCKNGKFNPHLKIISIFLSFDIIINLFIHLKIYFVFIGANNPDCCENGGRGEFN
jgi:hypothetical protein